MTEGIIREVLNKYLKEFENGLEDPYFSELYLRDIRLMKQLQQELIEKIKEECKRTALNSNWISVKVLIGDSNAK